MIHQTIRPLTAFAGFAALAFLSSQHAAAEAAGTPCPPDMEQQLYDMLGRIQRGEQSEVDPVIALARRCVESCPERAEAQAMASSLLASTVRATPETDRIMDQLTLIHTAVRQNEAAAYRGGEDLKVRGPDGEMVNYFGYNNATAAMTDTLIPALIALGQRGEIHPLISGAPLEACPYVSSPYSAGSSGRLMDELSVWSGATDGQEGQPVHTWAENRLKALHAACPDLAVEMNYALARFYGTVAVRMTDWRMDLQETYYGGSTHVYSLPAMSRKRLDETDYEAAKADYDARATPFAALTKQYLDSYYTALRTIEDSGTRYERAGRRSYTMADDKDALIRSWEKAIESVE